MGYLKSKDFWEAAAHRSIRTFAQTMVSAIPASAILTEINWTYIISTGLPEVEE